MGWALARNIVRKHCITLQVSTSLNCMWLVFNVYAQNKLSIDCIVSYILDVATTKLHFTIIIVKSIIQYSNYTMPLADLPYSYYWPFQICSHLKWGLLDIKVACYPVFSRSTNLESKLIDLFVFLSKQYVFGFQVCRPWKYRVACHLNVQQA